MWTRAELKDKAKKGLSYNYWKMVLASLLITILVGGGASASGSGASLNLGSDATGDYTYDESYDEFYDESFDDLFGDTYEEDEMIFDEEFLEDIFAGIDSKEEGFAVLASVVLIVFLIILVIALAVGLAITAFISNPIEVGCNRFFLQNLNEPANISEVAYAFDNSYKNVVKVMFFRTLYTTLWTLLFVIPGIIKSYEYRMIPYLLTENPNLTKEQAFALSKQMMMGQKWSAFVLDLSFIGWHILSLFTAGLLEVLYVAPYVHATDAALFEELNTIYGRPAMNTYSAEPYHYYYAPQQNPDEQNIEE